MKFMLFGATALLTALALCSPAAASQESELAEIKAQLATLQQAYDVKIRSLEARVAKAEADAKAARAMASADRPVAPAQSFVRPVALVAQNEDSSPTPQQTTAPPAENPAPAPQSTSSSASAFNPSIGVVLNGFFAASSRDTDGQRILGFALDEEAGLPPRGFSLGESEVNLAANVDPYLTAQLVLAFTNSGEAEVEEAYVATTGLGGGFTLKAGRFLSAIGYLNEHHAHQWSFSDAPLPYRAFLGGQLGDDGVQVKWLAPANMFLELGAEWLRGDSFPAGNGADEGKGTVTAFAHAGDDFDESSNWLAGLSYVHSEAKERDTGGDIFAGRNDLGIASLIYKWAPGGNPAEQNLTLSGEFFLGHEQGLFNGVPIDLARSGWYAQGVYQFVPRWSFGLRYSEMAADQVPPALIGSTLDDLDRSPRAATALLEFDTSEFGRFRLQYTHDESDLKANDEGLFQYTITYGAHGAHRY